MIDVKGCGGSILTQREQHETNVGMDGGDPLGTAPHSSSLYVSVSTPTLPVNCNLFRSTDCPLPGFLSPEHT